MAPSSDGHRSCRTIEVTDYYQPLYSLSKKYLRQNHPVYTGLKFLKCKRDLRKKNFMSFLEDENVQCV